MTPRTLYRKLVDSHAVAPLDEQNVLLFCDLHLMNEYTSPQAFGGLDEQGRGVPVPGQNVAVVSHVIPSEPVKLRVIHASAPALQASNLKRNCDRHVGRPHKTAGTIQNFFGGADGIAAVLSGLRQVPIGNRLGIEPIRREEQVVPGW